MSESETGREGGKDGLLLQWTWSAEADTVWGDLGVQQE